jgi:RNA polymerase sigma-70 factor, ECF subfamily
MLVLIDARPHTDDELLGSDDPQAFAAFYRRHVRWVTGYLMRRTADPELAADLTAETFAAALLHRSRFQPRDGSAAAWLYRIAHNTAVDAARRRGAERRARDALGILDVRPTVEDLSTITYLGSDVDALVAELPDDQRRAIVARVIDDRPYADIARAEAVSEAVVRKRVSRGLKALRFRVRKESR